MWANCKTALVILLRKAIAPVLVLAASATGNPALAIEKHAVLPVDLILVIESTTGMTRLDPEQLRQQASKRIIALLDPEDRASIISFSSDGYPVAYMTATSSTRNIDELFQAVDKLSAKGRHRNLHGALQAVQRVLERNPISSPRQTHVIVFSIGAMQLPKTSNLEQAGDDIKNRQLPWLKANHVFIHSLVMGDPAQHQLLQYLSSETGGHHFLLDSASQLAELFSKILIEIKQRRQLDIVNQNFNVPGGATFMQIYHDTTAGSLSFTTPSGKNYANENIPGNALWTSTAEFETVNIKNPESGNWHFSGTAGTVTLHSENNIAISYKLLPEKPKTGDELRIVAWLEKDNNTITDPAIINFIKSQLEISNSDGSKEVTSLFPMKTQAGKFTTTVKLKSSGDILFKLTMQDDKLKQENTFQISVASAVANTAERITDAPATSLAPDKTETTAASAVSNSTTSELMSTSLQNGYPDLQQALIIVTIANGLFIALGLVIYYSKRRMSGFSMTPLASLNRDDNAGHKSDHAELNSKAA